MSVNINRVLLVGRLTRDPELRHTAGGAAVIDLGVAVNGREKRGEEWVDRADFFTVRVWGGQAEAVEQYLKKGSPLGIDGRLRLEKWDDDSGGKHEKVLVVADVVQFLGSGSGSGGAGEQAPLPSDDDAPF